MFLTAANCIWREPNFHIVMNVSGDLSDCHNKQFISFLSSWCWHKRLQCCQMIFLVWWPRIPTSKGGRWPRKGCGVGESRCEGQRGASDQLAPPAPLIQPPQLTGGWVTQGGSRLGTLPQERICSNSPKRLSIVKVQSDGWKDYFTSMEREKGRIAVIRPLWWFWENQQEAWRNINFEKLQLQLKMLGLRQLRCKHYCVKLEI